MTQTRAAAIAGQVAVGVVAHASASGCLPTASGLVLALPVAVAAVFLLGRAVPGRPLARLGSGQFAVHGALTIGAACDGAHAPHVLMTYGHVAAVLLLHVGWDQTTRKLEDAVRTAARLVTRPLRSAEPLSIPQRQLVAARPASTPLVRLLLPASTGRRGPPARELLPLPA